jgi:hypothetical protein
METRQRAARSSSLDAVTLSRHPISDRADAAPAPLGHDLLIIASTRVDFFNVVQRFPGSASLEVRLDRRREQRRRSTAPPAASDDERRRRDRRVRAISDELRTVGWAFVPASERILSAYGTPSA